MERSKLLISLIVVSLYFAGNLSVFAQNLPSKKIDPSSISQSDLKSASSLAEKIVMGMEEENYYVFKDSEAIPSLKDKFTPDAQKEYYNERRKGLGGYVGGLEFVEAYQYFKTKSKKPMIVYRFKGNFYHERTKEKMEGEIRLMYYENNEKLAGIALFPWLNTAVGL